MDFEELTNDPSLGEYEDIISTLFKTKPHPAIRRRERADQRVEHVKNKFIDHFENKKLMESLSKIEEDCQRQLRANSEKLDQDQ